jgi:hypothetical protein
MNCRKFERAAYLYLKHELPRDQMKEAKLHLLRCDDCKTKYHKINILFQKTGEYIRSAEEADQPFLPNFSSITYKKEKYHHIFILYKLATAAALIFLIISLFVITRNSKDIKKTNLKKENIVSAQQARSITVKKDVDKKTKSKTEQMDRPVQKLDKPIIRDEFSESYSRWLNARRNTTEPVMVEVIYPDLDIKIIYLLKNK